MSRTNEKVSRALGKEIKPLSQMEQVTRFVRSLSAFQPDHNLPDRFDDLLGRLEQAEQAAANSNRAGEGSQARQPVE